ncbi:MAG TPA: BamA/TamA family outer membrane protein [Gemmatimonadaceae bacterium]|nr:BamA/TamA family outer membrane protein [Gemmatimonadaceae bacterium]
MPLSPAGSGSKKRWGAAFIRPFVVAALMLAPAWSARLGAQEVDCDNKGDKRVRSLKFVGNTAFSSDQLSAIVLTTPSSFWRRYFHWFFGVGAERCLPDVGLEPDVDNLTQFYKNDGYYDTKVETAVVPVGTDVVDVSFKINEGQPLVLDSLQIAGLDSVAGRDEILKDLRLKVGRRFGDVAMYADEDSIVARLRNAGYPGATVFPARSVNKAAHRAKVELSVIPGVIAKFGTVAVKSLNRDNGPAEIDSAVVLRLLGFKSGDQYSVRAMSDAQRNLYNLGVYRHVGIDVDTVARHGDSIADVTVDLREDYMRQLDVDEGWATLDCFRVNGQYTDKNFLDNAQRVELTGRLSKLGFGRPTDIQGIRNFCRHELDADSIGSSKLNYYAGATLRRPTLFGSHWVPSYSAYTERRGQYLSFLRTTYLGLEASATRDIGVNMPLRGAYTFEFGQTTAEPAVLCFVFSRCLAASLADAQRKTRLAVISTSLRRVHTDNAVDPTSGYVLGGELRGSAPFLYSDAQLTFGKATMDGSWYHRLVSRTVFAARVRGGFVQSSNAADALLPPQERLYAGGATSVRGFGQNELGPIVYLLDSAQFKIDTLTDSTFNYVAKKGARASRTSPVGGSVLAVINAELRIHDPFFPELLEYVPFIDAGQVWTRQVAGKGLNREALAVTPGIGVRLFSPIGPIQMNAGYNPNRSRTGPAFFPTPVDPTSLRAPLICVTAPGETPVTVKKNSKTGLLEQDIAACPATFVPTRSSSFFSRFILTLSIGTDF